MTIESGSRRTVASQVMAGIHEALAEESAREVDDVEVSVPLPRIVELLAGYLDGHPTPIGARPEARIHATEADSPGTRPNGGRHVFPLHGNTGSLPAHILADNRVAPRYDIDIEVQLTSPGSVPVPATTRDLSVSGVRVRSRTAHEVGTRLHLDFPTFEASAEVMWAREPVGSEDAQIGMRFVSLSKENKRGLLELLDSPQAVPQPIWNGTPS